MTYPFYFYDCFWHASLLNREQRIRSTNWPSDWSMTVSHCLSHTFFWISFQKRIKSSRRNRIGKAYTTAADITAKAWNMNVLSCRRWRCRGYTARSTRRRTGACYSYAWRCARAATTRACGARATPTAAGTATPACVGNTRQGKLMRDGIYSKTCWNHDFYVIFDDRMA